MKVIKVGQNSYYKRNDKVWPWGYYRAPKSYSRKGQSGHFVCMTELEARRGASK
jgi:hypothetical protein